MKKTNLELKHFCKDFKKIRSILKDIGARKVITKTQKDYFFNLPNLDKNSSSRLKLRIEKNVDDIDEKDMALIYYERPKFNSKRDNTSNVLLYFIKDNELLTFLEKSLGTKAIVEKIREVWKKGNTVFHLDTIKKVGKIFEIELQKVGRLTAKDRKIFDGYKKKLIPVLGELIKGSNLDLVKN